MNKPEAPAQITGEGETQREWRGPREHMGVGFLVALLQWLHRGCGWLGHQVNNNMACMTRAGAPETQEAADIRRRYAVGPSQASAFASGD